MSTISKHQLIDATCQMNLAYSATESAHNFSLGFESNKLQQVKGTVKFDVDFNFPKDETFTQHNVYLAIVNYLLHELYDSMAMLDKEENVFCEINNCLEDNLKHWQQGEVYINKRDELFLRAPIGYSATDIIRITEGKLKSIIDLTFKSIK